MTDTIVPFPRVSTARPRIKAAQALRSCLGHLAEEADRAALPLTAIVIGLAMVSIEEDLAIEDDLTGGD
jgi:hypothetical protein